MKKQTLLRALCAAGTIFLFVGAASAEEPKKGVQITNEGDKIKVEIGGALFTEYHFTDVPRPFFYPLIGPTDEGMTRNWPMQEGENEEQDHVHHRSLWYTHGDINGQDFWSETENAGKVVQDKLLKVESGPEMGVIETTDKYVAADGVIVCTDTRTHRFYNRPDGRFIDFDITFHASNGEVVLGDTKEGSMAIRVAPTMRLKGKVGQGHIVNSEGVRDEDAWGKRAEWCDFYGPVKGQVVGVAIFDHPTNPRHPTWWHARNYGLLTANPFGAHNFEGKPAGTGNIKIPAGENLTFRYRVYLHKGDEKEGKVAERFAEYAKMQ